MKFFSKNSAEVLIAAVVMLVMTITGTAFTSGGQDQTPQTPEPTPTVQISTIETPSVQPMGMRFGAGTSKNVQMTRAEFLRKLEEARVAKIMGSETSETPETSEVPEEPTEKETATEGTVIDELPEGAQLFGECQITYYCCEKYTHICGTGDGVTASGRPVTADVSVAVDPSCIPLGSRVFVDFGDGEGLHEYRADDTGSMINGLHIDIAKQTHNEALSQTKVCGIVYFIPPQN